MPLAHFHDFAQYGQIPFIRHENQDDDVEHNEEEEEEESGDIDDDEDDDGFDDFQ